MRVQDSRLLVSAGGPEEFPRAELPEIAFAGRSNVGKSSLLNALIGRRKLARISSTPGCTQRINFFLLDRKLLFADLPGHGYARVPDAVRASWEPMVRSYLEEREPLRLVWVLVDSRHPPTDGDGKLVEWLRWQQVPFRIAMTKSDRLSGNQRAKARRTCAAALVLSGDDEPVLTSARTRTGIAAMWREIHDRVAAAPRPTGSRSGEPSSQEGRASPPGDRGADAADPTRPVRSTKENTAQ